MAFTMRAQTQSEEMKSLWMDRFIDRKYPDRTTEVMNFCMASDQVIAFSELWRKKDPADRAGYANEGDFISQMIAKTKEASGQRE